MHQQKTHFGQRRYPVTSARGQGVDFAIVAGYRLACIGSLASFWLIKEENHENHAPKKHTRINRVSVRNSPRGTPY